LLSLVPADASDIRDASPETFADLDQRTFRADLFTVVGGVLFALAGLVALLTIVRLVVRARPGTRAGRLIGDGAILRGVGRELSAVQREREAAGWSDALAARALAALRILGTYALGRTPSRVALNGAPPTSDGGRLIVSKGWTRGKQIAVSGSITQRSIGSAIAQPTNGRRAGELESLGDALTRFTVAEYGRGGKLDDGALDESLAAGRQLLKRLQMEQIWIVRRLRGRKAVEKPEGRVWSR
jgi:hypothetical protein